MKNEKKRSTNWTFSVGKKNNAGKKQHSRATGHVCVCAVFGVIFSTIFYIFFLILSPLLSLLLHCFCHRPQNPASVKELWSGNNPRKWMKIRMEKSERKKIEEGKEEEEEEYEVVNMIRNVRKKTVKWNKSNGDCCTPTPRVLLRPTVMAVVVVAVSPCGRFLQFEIWKKSTTVYGRINPNTSALVRALNTQTQSLVEFASFVCLFVIKTTPKHSLTNLRKLSGCSKPMKSYKQKWNEIILPAKQKQSQNFSCF